MWDDGVWRFQRSELFELREDLHTNQIMNSLIIPMLERMGAKLTVVRGVGSKESRSFLITLIHSMLRKDLVRRLIAWGLE